jgi:hypothetical protein
MNEPERHVENFIKEIADSLKDGGDFAEAIVALVAARIAVDRAIETLIDAQMDDDDEDHIPDGWPPE